MHPSDFAAKIQAHYPEGLTGIFAIGGTRRTFILDQNRHLSDPGQIDFNAMGTYLQTKYFEFANMFFGLGGQNMIITALSFRSFYERGPAYAEGVTRELRHLFDQEAIAYYTSNNIDPYFVGIDTLKFVSVPEMRQLEQELRTFTESWQYNPAHKKLLWEIASIPLYTFWSQHQTDEQTEAQKLNFTSDSGIDQVWTQLYEAYAMAGYGTKLPLPHFYLGNNPSGDLKWRSPMPISLSGGEHNRMYFVPYPLLFMQQNVLQAILNDLAFAERHHSRNKDYKGQYTQALAETEYQRILALANDPSAVLGLTRTVAQPSGTAGD
jgi:hypothetical protein